MPPMARIFARLARLTPRTDLPIQVAAVCYRRSESSVEFLLVKTSAGKWTFPKGRLNPSMSASESAALEAWEEAGARGRIAEQHFGSYLDVKRGLRHDSGASEVRILAYLFEVYGTVPPEEIGRDPNWFSPNAAKKQLAEGRSSHYARQIANIIDSAMEHLTTRNGRRLPVLVRSQGHRVGGGSL